MNDRKTSFRGFYRQNCDESFVSPVFRMKYTDNGDRYNREVERLIFAEYDDTIEAGKKTVGIPRALFTYGMFPMFNAFFRTLGLNVVMSEPTSEKTIGLGQEYSLDETCYPVKLINGHVAELIKKNVDYIFFPDLYSVDHPGSHTRKNFGCAYMQLAFKIVNQAMDLEKKGIELLAPTIAFSMGKEFMKNSFYGLGRQLNRNPKQTFDALQAGMKAFHEFEHRLEQNGKKVIESLKPDERVFVLISKIYGLADPVLNMGIPGKLMDMGHKVISFYDLPEGDISREHPNMYWPFGQHILEAARFINRHPNMYAVFLTHHCCGPDSVLTHFFKETMGEKPYLNIEVDEHSSAVGVITRVEAFVNSFRDIPVISTGVVEKHTEQEALSTINIVNTVKGLKKGTTLWMPHIFPYAHICGQMLNRQGLSTKIMPHTNGDSVKLGRKHTMTNEYFSLTALLGDSLFLLDSVGDSRKHSTAIFIPQTEGSEVHGQYNRMLRTTLDQQGYPNVRVISPFLEDVICGSSDDMKKITWGLLAGDLVRIAPPGRRGSYLDAILGLVAKDCCRIEDLEGIAKQIRDELKGIEYDKRIFALGEFFILYNDFLNNYCLRDIERKGHRVLYSPLAECLWLMWRDYADQNENDITPEARNNLAELENAISLVSDGLGDESTFEKRASVLLTLADKTVGYYAGAHGRYRGAKVLAERPRADGIVTVAATYENTGIALGILHRGLDCEKPVLNLTFDGNRNENDSSRIASFLYYL